MKITLNDIIIAGSITQAIEQKALESDTIASGIIGPSFATSGPGSGWTKQYDVNDYAKRALSEEYGASSYIDSDDGREATLDINGDIEWTEQSILELVAPNENDAAKNPEILAEMVNNLPKHPDSNAEQWDRLLITMNLIQ